MFSNALNASRSSKNAANGRTGIASPACEKPSQSIDIDTVRLQKFLAEAGLGSRRACEQLIVQGSVLVNGKPATELGTRIHPTQDQVVANGKPVKPLRKVCVALHKPAGCVTSRRDPQGRPTVLDLLPKEWSHLFPIGRLDYDTEGLLLLTNDGELCLRLTHPRFGIRKTYIAVVKGRLAPSALAQLTRGVFHEGERLRAVAARVLSSSLKQSRIELTLREGRNREIHRIFEVLGTRVLHLIRIRIGTLQLGALPRGAWRQLTAPDLDALLGRAASVTSPQSHPTSAASPRRPAPVS